MAEYIKNKTTTKKLDEQQQKLLRRPIWKPQFQSE